MDVLEKVPFKVHSIQVDGGSEFMADVEQTCADLNIPLMVLTPRKPQYNGGVEQSNRTLLNEFYGNPNLLADSIGYLRAELSKALQVYTTYRYHFIVNPYTKLDSELL